MDIIEYIDSSGLPRAIRKISINQLSVLENASQTQYWLNIAGVGFCYTLEERSSLEEILPIYDEWVQKVWGKQ